MGAPSLSSQFCRQLLRVYMRRLCQALYVQELSFRNNPTRQIQLMSPFHKGRESGTEKLCPKSSMWRMPELGFKPSLDYTTTSMSQVVVCMETPSPVVLWGPATSSCPASGAKGRTSLVGGAPPQKPASRPLH